MKDIKCAYACNQSTRVVSRVHVYIATRNFGACNTRIKRVSHAFGVELVAGLYRIRSFVVV